MKPPFAIATSTWNSADLIEGFLEHYKRLDASVIFVADLGSTDGTLDILDSPRWRGMIHHLRLEKPLEVDFNPKLLELARSTLGDGWCTYLDPDEFLVTPNMTLYDTCAEDTPYVVVPEHNVTARRSAADGTDAELSPFGALTLRIDGCIPDRKPSEKVSTEPLTPPWIFNCQPGKVVVRLDHEVSLHPGAHRADVSGVPEHSSPIDCYILHFPFRTYEEFWRKIDMADLHFSAYGSYDEPRKKGGVPRTAWHYYRWIECRDRGELYDEWVAQFLPDDVVSDLLADGTLVEDTRVKDFHSRSVASP